jgi:predicted acylesterase/phospholipase RssA
MDVPPLRIALSGGGMKGIAHVGALEVLHERGLLKCVREYIGTSAGALIALCMVLGYTLQELRTLCTLFDFSLMLNLEPETILLCPDKFGLDNRLNLDRLLVTLLKAKGYGAATTFEDLRELPKQLRVYAANITNCDVHEFSLKATPRVELRVAVQASMCVPFYFTPVVHPDSGHFLVDGGIIAHFPFIHLTDAERAETIGVAFTKQVHDSKIDTLLAYIMHLYTSVYHHQNQHLYSKWGHRIIRIECGRFPSFHFEASAAEKTYLMNKGREAVESTLARRASATITRRNSLP